jgi:hypothetical protein
MPNTARRSCSPSQHMAAVFKELDALWDLPSTPERRARMESLLKTIEPEIMADQSFQLQLLSPPGSAA